MPKVADIIKDMALIRLTLNFRDQPLQTFELSQAEITIGRDDRCDIQIDSLAVAPHHASILTNQSEATLVTQDSEFETRLNERKITDTALKAGDRIGIGKYSLSCDYLGSASQATPINDHAAPNIKACFLQMMNGSELGRLVPLDRAMVKISTPEGHVIAIVHREGGYFVSQLKGGEAPVVNGESIGDHSQQLEDGNTIEIGSKRLQFFVQ